MRIKSKRIKAFTLNEMIVVLLITSIIVGMAFSVLNLVQRQMSGIGSIYDVKTETNKLRQSLWMDFYTYPNVFYEAKEERLYFGNELEMKFYELQENMLVTEKDTFRIQLESAAFYFDNLEVFLGEIDAVRLQTGKEAGNRQIFVYKQNTATTYLNQ